VRTDKLFEGDPKKLTMTEAATEAGPAEIAAAKAKMAEGGKTKVRKVASPSDRAPQTRDKIGKFAGVSGRHLEKIIAVMTAARDDAKVKAQAEYVVWRDSVVTPSQSSGGPGRGKKGVSDQKPVLPATDPGQDVADRWRKDLCHKGETGDRYREIQRQRRFSNSASTSILVAPGCAPDRGNDGAGCFGACHRNPYQRPL
jgi:hypothetical protein